MEKRYTVQRKMIPVVALVFALAAVVIGATIAYNRDRSVISNVFEISDYRVEFSDTFQSPSNWLTGQTVPKEIKVTNRTNTPVVARVKLTETWDSKDGMGLPLVGAQSNVRMAIVNYLENSGWTLDGTWWYSPVLQPGETSTSLITGVTLNEDADLGADWRYGGATYKLSAKAEVIQSELAATEWHKKAVVSVSSIVSRAAALGRILNDGYDFVRSDTKIDMNGQDSDYYIHIDSESNTPVYMWLVDHTLYWYSDADDIYLTNGSENGTSWTGFYSGQMLFLKSLTGMRDFNTSRMKSMYELFIYPKMTSLDGLETWDVSNVTNMHNMFYYGGGDGAVTDISALSRWDVSNVTDMSYMFSGNNEIADVTALSGWNVRNVSNFTNFMYRTAIDESICQLADWPIVFSGSTPSISSMLYTLSKSPLLDGTCLEPWNVPETNGQRTNVLNKSAFTLPTWAQWH